MLLHGELTKASLNSYIQALIYCMNLFSAGQYISIHSLDGSLLNTIRCHEGFMGPKIGQTSCLSFHPHKVSIAAGFMDNTVSVYVTVPSE